MDGKEIDGGKIVLRVSKYLTQVERPTAKNTYNNLFVKNLPSPSFSEDDLKSLFDPFGEILSSIIVKDENGESRCFGFVCFKKSEDAIKAALEMNGKDGLYVVRALKKADRQAEIKRNTEMFKKSLSKLNLYVREFPKDTTEDELAEFFG